MGYGGAITLIVLGLIFLTGVIQFDIPGIGEQGLGMILLLAGIAVIVLMNTVWRTRGVASTTYVSEPRERVVSEPQERVVSEPRERVVEREVIERDVPPERI
ncbi:MAG TPA: DUF6458 family protein [Aeromicrobium sp.]|nr:DUF6458 family protein [Aeromicrobium sp.]